MYQHFLDILDQFGAGGTGGPENLAVRFLLAAFFWAILALLAGRNWQRGRSRRDLVIFIAVTIGLVRELSMFASEYGGWLGYLSFQESFKFYPPFEHALTMFSGLLISYAFISYFRAWPNYEKLYLQIGSILIVFLYLIIAPTWINYLRVHPETLFGAFWGDMAFRVTASFLLGTALIALTKAKGRKHIPLNLIIGITFLFLDEFIMIFNLYTNEVHVQSFAPIRHNLHIWAIPLFIATYWGDLRRREVHQRAKSEAIIAGLGDGLSIQDRNLKVVYQNKVHQEMMGDQVGRHCYRAFNNQDEVCQDCPVVKSFADGEIHKVIRYNSSRDLHIEITASPLTDHKGKITASIELVRDISERYKMEAELRKTHKLESLGVLAGGIAHDFNNILSGVMGNISMARAIIEDGDPLNGNVEEFLVEAENASIRARDLTQQLLTFAKGGAPVKQAASIVDLVRESAGFVVRGSRVVLEIKVEEGLWSAEVDAGQFSQVIQNLVINAMQATAGSGRILIEMSNIVSAAAESDDEQAIVIRLSDNGCGIPQEIMNRIFDPFFSSKEEGSGLGLSIVYSIIKNHGGQVSVESVEGEGAEFTILLPAVDAEVAENCDAEDKIYPGRGRVLLVDDNEIVCAVLKKMLTRAGYEAVAVHDGKDGLELYLEALQSGKVFAAVILDLTIPGGMGGRETIEKLLEIDPAVKAIVSSGYANDPVMADYEKYGFKDVVPKPCNISELTFSLHRLLSENDIN